MPRGTGKGRVSRGRGKTSNSRIEKRKSTSYSGKHSWNDEGSEGEDDFDSDNEADFTTYKPRKSARRSNAEKSSEKQVAVDAALEQEDEEDVQYFDEQDLEDQSNASNKVDSSDEYTVDFSSDEASVDSTVRTKRSSRVIVKPSTEPSRCVWIDREDLPELVLSKSSEDLLLPNQYTLRALEIYEVCRRYGTIAKLSPFLFEDFCACLSYRYQNPLLDEIHIALLRCLIKDDETNHVTFGPYECRDSINISNHLLDQYTYGEVLKRYVESDERFYNYEGLYDALISTNYPFVDLEKRLIVLQWLSRQFLATQALRNEINADGVIQHDDHCRECGKPGKLLCCDTCPAVYHLDCCNPPLDEFPSTGWLCEICILHDVKGVSDCRTDAEKAGQLIRQDILGYDRHGRRYWFLVRRLFIEDEKSGDIIYYSTLSQIQQLFSCLDEMDLEKELCQKLVSIGSTIIEQMTITEELTESRRRTAMEKDPSLKSSYLCMDKRDRTVNRNENGEKPLSNGTGSASSNEISLQRLVKQMDALLTDVTVNLERCDSLDASTVTTRRQTGSLPISRSTRDKTSKSLVHRTDEPPENGLVSDMNNDEKDEAESDKQQQRQCFLFDVGPLFKLGQDRLFLRYNNQFSSNPLSKNPYARAEERSRTKYMCNRFLMEDEGEFKWPLDLATTPNMLIRMVKSSLLKVANRIRPLFVHPHLIKNGFYEWRNSLISSPRDTETLAALLADYEANLRPVVFSETYKSSTGHTKFYRSTVEDREERQRKEKSRRKELSERSSADPTDETSSLIWVKYTLYTDGPPRHQIWKQRDEGYRVNGDGQLGGWLWIRTGRNMQWVEQGETGLASGPAWQSNYASIIDELLAELQCAHEDGTPLDQVEGNGQFGSGVLPPDASIAGQPLCAELPMEFDVTTAAFEMNREKAISQLGLRQHAEGINVSLGLAQHSIYYKVAKKSKCLDRLLLYRMKQDEMEETKRKTEEQRGLSNELVNAYVCYSYDCRMTKNGGSCYSLDCRRFAKARTLVSDEGTTGIHRLKLLNAGDQTKKDWMKENSSASPPPPVTANFRTSNSQPKSSCNILVLPKHVVKRLAKKAGIQEAIEGFNHTVKANSQVWPYPCIRPTFQTCWRYHLQRADSLHALALLFRIFYHNIRWDQLALSRDLNATYVKKFENTSEHRKIIGHQFLPPWGLRVRYLVQLTRVPSDYCIPGAVEDETTDESNDEGGVYEETENDEQYNAGSTSRKKAPWSLRERKVVKKPRAKQFEKSERWLYDDDLMIWEIKNYWLRKERDVKKVKQIEQLRNQRLVGQRAGISANRAIVSGNADISASNRRDVTFKRPAALQRPSVVPPQMNKPPDDTPPTLTIPLPKPNSTIIVDVGDGQRLIVSNKPAVAGGPCVLTIQNVEATKVVLPRPSQDAAVQDGGQLPGDGIRKKNVDILPKINLRPSILPPRKSRNQQSRSYSAEQKDEAADLNDESDPNYTPDGRPIKQDRRSLVSAVSHGTPDGQEGLSGEKKRIRDFVKEERLNYYREYRLKRKKLQAVDDRAALWRENILHRRETLKSALEADVKRHLTDSILEKIVQERTLLGWPPPTRPYKQLAPLSSPPERVQSTTTPIRPFKYSAPMPIRPQQVQSTPVRPPTVTPKHPIGITASSNIDLQARKRPSLDIPVQITKKPRDSFTSPFSRGTANNVASPMLITDRKGKKLETVPSANGQNHMVSQDKDTKQQELHCICQKPLDKTKFYVMCDLCGGWFHGKCVGITQKMSRQMTTWSCHRCQKAREEATQELYCICRTPYDERQSYVCCDSCDGWFHCSCVGILPEEADSLPNFLCPNCEKRQGGDKDGSSTGNNNLCARGTNSVSPLSAVTKRLNDADYSHLEMLVNSLLEHQMSWPFRNAVDQTKYPGYYDIVRNHIDLSIMKKKFAARQYQTLSEFATDVVAIFNNARFYYMPDSPEFQCATVLDQYFTKELRDVKLAIAASAIEEQQNSSLTTSMPTGQRNSSFTWNGKAPTNT